MNKNKFEIEIEEFDNAFGKYKEKKIALYGTGRMTVTLLNANLDYNFVGVCDRNNDLCEFIHGVRVMTKEEVERCADILVINTSPTYWNTIYSRIDNWNIPIFFRNGERAGKTKTEVDLDNPYWNNDMAVLKNTCEQYDIISFDIFGTILQRMYVSDADLFDEVGYVIETKNILSKRKYSFWRKEATAKIDVNSNIHEIYDSFQKISFVDKSTCEMIKKLEFETDKKHIIGRKKIVDLCNELMKNKKVIFVSDMYYDRDMIYELLCYVGLETSIDNLFISCEEKRQKADGTIWNYVNKYFDVNFKMIHIGDNWESDYVIPRSKGIESFYIMSPLKMLEMTNLNRVIGKIRTFRESFMLGLIMQHTVNNPFDLSKGKIVFENNKDLGYVLLGPLVLCFNKWIISEITKLGKNKIAFFAREGYFMKQQFEVVQKFESVSAETKYIYISRRAVMNACIKDKESLIDVATFPYKGKFGDYMKERFNINIKGDMHCKEEGFQSDIETLWNYLKPYYEDILYEAERQRNNFLLYLKSNDLDKETMVVDSFIYGSTQYYLGKILNEKLNGLYLIVNKEDNVYNAEQNMYSCFQTEDDISGKNNAIWKNALFLESFFTAPDGMLFEVDESLKPVFCEKKSNQSNFCIRDEINRGIHEFLDDWYAYGGGEVDCQLVLNIFESLMDEGFEVSDSIKEAFFYDNEILDNKEVQIFG